MLPFIRLKNKKPLLSPDVKLIKADTYQQYLTAQDLINNAEQEAKNILSHAKECYEEEKRRGYERGLKNSKVEHMEKMLDTVGKTINYVSGVEDSMVNIAMSATRQIIGSFDDAELTLGIVKNALHLLSNEKQVTLHVEPAQLDIIKQRVHEVLADYPGIGFIEVVADSRLAKGGCRLESPMGVVDASVDVQLAALTQALKKNFSDKH